jgi:diguanylate cyclase (GGDEF)-like protein
MDQSIGQPGEIPPVTPPNPPVGEARTLLWLTLDPLGIIEGMRQLGYFGYTVLPLPTCESILTTTRAQPPAGVILEINNAGDEQLVLDTISTLVQEQPGLLSAVFVIGPDNLALRLRIARAGGSSYFPHPLDLSRLLGRLDALAQQGAPDPYRVLLVDDDPMLTRYYARVLARAGMVTLAVNDPLAVFQTLENFYPDLILMDMYMPDYTGPELALVIRDQEQFVGVPVVFLSGENDREKQLAALQVGADDFLTKPIAPAHLVAAVSSRAERARTLRRLLMRDSLTGLLNHTTTKERLDGEVARALRQGTPLAFAFLDLDHFKSINDTYGHPVGDGVIRNMARLLQGRLRRSDLIGRYGGEEFAVILPDTPVGDAARVMEDLRMRFAAIEQHAGGGIFYATFSCGVAGVPPALSAASLTETADQALYRAKQQGRNRVIVG